MASNTKEDSLKKVRAYIFQRQQDSIAKVHAINMQILIRSMRKSFRYEKDEFSGNNEFWVYDKSVPKFVDVNKVYVYFKLVGNRPLNFRFRIQYTSDDWLFIQSYIFNVDGRNYEYNPVEMHTDNKDYIWEWCDDPLDKESTAIVKAIMGGTKVKVKMIGRQYYNIRALSKNELEAIRRTVRLYRAYGGDM